MSLCSVRESAGEGASCTHTPYDSRSSHLCGLELKGPPTVVSVTSQERHSFPPPLLVLSLRSRNPPPPKSSLL